jgi:predicted permease
MMSLADDLARDLRYAARTLTRTPAFTAVAVLSLALGIGANTAIFSVVDALMLRPLDVHEPEHLILLTNSSGNYVQYSMFEKLRDAAASTADLSAIIRTDRYNVGVSGAAGGSSQVDGGPVRVALVSGNYFSTLGTVAAMGRTLAPDDDRPSGAPVVVVSDDYWSRRLGKSAAILGRTLTFGDTAYDIVGVAPRGFLGEWIGRPADVWIPIVRQPQIMIELPVGGLQNAGAFVIGRVKARSEDRALQALLQTAFERETRAQLGPNPTPQQLRQIAGNQIAVASGARGFSPQRESFGRSLTMLMTAVGLVLVVACANIANLLLARSESRRREMAVRLAVGASRARLVRQMLTESVLLAMLGGLVGVLVAQWATAALASFVRSGPVTGASVVLSMDLDVHPDARVLVFTAALCVVTGILFGLAPAFRGSRVSLSPALLTRGAAADPFSSRGRLSLGRALVVVQVAVSLVLVVGAGLLVRTLRNLTLQELGFERQRLLLVWALPGQTGGRGAGAADFWRTAMDRVVALPGVVSVSASNQGVLNGSDLSNLGNGPGLRIEGEAQAPTGLPGLRSFVAPGFFKTMGIRLVAGRDFSENDVATSARGVIISQAMARHYFGHRDPVGRRIWFPEDSSAPTAVIGVADDVLVGGPRETVRRPGYTYFSYRDREAPRRLRTMTMAVRTAGEPMAMADAIRRELQGAPLQLPVLRIDTAGEQLSDILVQERMVTTLSTAFGSVSLLLACFGLYGVISYTVARRTSEIGIRMALGATRSGMVRAFMTESLALVVVGIVAGALTTVGVTRLIASRLFGVGAADPATMATGIALVVLAAALAAALPARRAARVDPMVALRFE